MSDKNKEKLLKTLLSDDEEYKNIKTNKELIFSTLGLDFIQGFYEQSTHLPPENPAMSRRSRRSITPSINRERNKLSDKEKQDLFKLLLENQNFEEDQFKVFLNKLTKENPAIIIEFFKLTSQFDIYQIKILKSLDPKTLAEKFILEDSIITQESKTSFLKSYLELGNLDNNKILIDLISRSSKSSILEPLFQDDNRDLIFNSCKGSTFYHKFIETQDGELDEETQSKRVSMYLSSNKNNEQKIELLNLLAQQKPDLFVKKLLEDSEDFKNSLSPKMFTETLKMESFDAPKKMEIFFYLAQKKSDIIDSDEETKNAFAQAFFSSPKSIKTVENEPVSEIRPNSSNPGTASTKNPDDQTKLDEVQPAVQIPETTTAKLKQIFNAILPSTQSITLKPHYISPQNGPLKDFKLGFFNSNSIADFQAESLQYKNLFHQQFDTLFQKILNTYSSKNEQQQSQLKTSLYAILAISSGNITDRNGEEIKKFLAYSNEILKGNYNQETRTGDGHGSWIGQDSIRFKKAMTILAKMDNVFDNDNSAFSKSNLQRWLESQYHTPEVKIALNKDSDEYVRNILLITASNTKHEVSIRDTIKDFLSDNLEMLKTLYTDKSGNGKKLLDYSYDEFSKSELSKLSSGLNEINFTQKLEDLKNDFPTKIAYFKSTLNNVRLLNQYIETEDGQLLLKFICQLSNHNFGNILKRDVSDSEQITGINSFIKDLRSPRSFHQLKDDLIKIGQGISEKIPNISPENPAQVAGQESVNSR